MEAKELLNQWYNQLMKEKYDLVKQVKSEVQDFLTGTINITSLPGANGKSFDYKFSQRETIAVIDLYWNSQFKSGSKDSKGMEKLFLNVGKFRTEVAEMQIDIDIANFLFIPTTEDYWTPWFMSKDFHRYAREKDFGEVINDWGADLPRYGTAVSKRVGKEVKRVAISRLMCTQSAHSLKEAATSGGYVIEQMELTQQQAEKYPDWNLANMPDTKGTKVFYERYGLISDADIKLSKGETPQDADWDEQFLGMAVVCEDIENKGKSNASGLLFAEKIEEEDFPYNEVHWARQDGRWLGIGEMENQFQNQLAKNLSTYYRQKSMMWAAKRMFAKTSSEGPDNLATEVEDGGAVYFGIGGQVTPINTQTQHLGDFQQWDNNLESQADKVSFTYEAATGDSPKAGTPYSLQVQMDNTLQKHFGKKKERFAAFLRRNFFDQMVPIFKADRRKDHTLSFKADEEGIGLLREAMIDTHASDRWCHYRLYTNKRPTMQEVREEVIKELTKSPYLIAQVPKGAYDKAETLVDIVITGENRNIFAEMETLKTLLADARAEGNQEEVGRLKREIISLTGRMPMSANAQMKTAQMPQAQAPQAPVPPNPVMA